MEALPTTVFGEIVDRLPNARCCALLACAFRAAHSEAQRRCDACTKRWLEWLGESYLGSKVDSRMTRRGGQLDMQLFRVIDDDSLSASFACLDNRERRWLHMRAASMALITTTFNRWRDLGGHSSDVFADLQVTKPRRWCMPWDDPPSVPATTKACVAVKRLRRQEWKGWCESCHGELGSWSAMFDHERGLGPYCESCIDLDDELRDLPWECNAESY